MHLFPESLKSIMNPFHKIICYSVSRLSHPNKTYRRGQATADMILKNYFNKRSDLQQISIIQLLKRLKNLKLGTGFFNDHRWIHLNMQVERNIEQFNNQQLFQILGAFTNLKYFNDSFNTVLSKLTNRLNSLSPNQKALLFYFLAKRGKSNKEMMIALSDSLLKQLNKQSIRLTYGKDKINVDRNKKQNKEKDQQEQDEQSLFNEYSNLEVGTKSEQIDCRNLALCLWALQKMNIKDNLLTDAILKKIFKPNISSMPCSVFPLILSALWMNNLHKKRLFSQITYQLTKREQELNQMDRDKLKMLACMLCKPEIDMLQQHKSEVDIQIKNELEKQRQKELSEVRRKIVLWILETLLLRIENKKQFMYPTACYQLISNASQANFFSFDIYRKYLTMICSDVSKIEIKQMIYLLSVIRKMRISSKNITNNSNSNQICEEQYQVLTDHVIRNLYGFLNHHQVSHPARKQLTKMMMTGFITLPSNLKKRIIHEQRQNKRQKLAQNNNQSQSTPQKIKSEESTRLNQKFNSKTQRGTNKRNSERKQQNKIQN